MANDRNAASVARVVSEDLTNEPTEIPLTVTVNPFCEKGFRRESGRVRGIERTHRSAGSG